MRTFKKVDGKVRTITFYGEVGKAPILPIILRFPFSKTARKELAVVRALKSEQGGKRRNDFQTKLIENLVPLEIGCTQAMFIGRDVNLNPEARHILKRILR
ncbi:MAG: hypothetical protein WC861_07350 [Candidatus Micrarchaeia archaeon]